MGGMTVAYQEAYRNASNGSVAGEGADTEATKFGLAYTMGQMQLQFLMVKLQCKLVQFRTGAAR